MSIQTYINRLASVMIYRLQHLDRFTDHIYIALPLNEETKPIIYYESREDTHELCDILFTLINSQHDYTWLTSLLLYCPEHEATRELQIINLD
jgi:hypothetical protein